jgi:hypothetical protein
MNGNDWTKEFLIKKESAGYSRIISLYCSIIGQIDLNQYPSFRRAVLGGDKRLRRTLKIEIMNIDPAGPGSSAGQSIGKRIGMDESTGK